MKFLVTARSNDAYHALPAQKRRKLVEDTVAFIEANRRPGGKCSAIYYESDLKGTVFIWEVNSDEEVTRDLMDHPMWRYTDFDIQLLIEWDTARKVVLESLERWERAAKT